MSTTTQENDADCLVIEGDEVGDEVGDELLATALSMGFDAHQVREAIAAGCKTMNAVIDRLVSSPAQTPAQTPTPTLRLSSLADQRGSNPVAVTPKPTPPKEPMVVSRFQQEARDAKREYERRQADARRKEVLVEKRRKHKERELVKQRLAADLAERKRNQQQKQQPQKQDVQPGDVRANRSGPIHQGMAEDHAAIPSFTVQVRTMHGAHKTLTFPESATVRDVFTDSEIDPTQYELIMARPHRRFSEHDLNKTLRELGLPARLALNAKPLNAGDARSAVVAVHQHDRGERTVPRLPLRQPSQSVAPTDGSTEESGEDDASNHPQHSDDDEEDDEEDGMNDDNSYGDSHHDNLFNPIGRLFRQRQSHVFAGQGHRLGDPTSESSSSQAANAATSTIVEHPHDLQGHQGNQPSRTRTEMAQLRAARYAAKRAARAEQSPSPSDSDSEGSDVDAGSHGGKLLRMAARHRKRRSKKVQVPSLQQLCIKNISERIHATDHPIVSLSHVPVDVAELILKHMLRDGRLTSKTIKVFKSCCIETLEFDNAPTVSDEMLQCIAIQFPVLRGLAIRNCDVVTKTGIQHLQHAKRLATVLLEGHHFQDSLMASLQKLKHLQSLSLQRANVSSAAAASYLRSAAAAGLTNLSFKGCTQLSDAIMVPLSKLKNLAILNLSGTGVEHVDRLVSCTMLRVLTLNDTRVTSESIAAIATLPLAALHVKNVPLSAEAYAPWQGHQNLASVTLSSQRTFSDACLHSLVTIVNLTSVTLSGCARLSSEALSSVWTMPNLQNLDLSNTQASDAMMLRLCSSRRHAIVSLSLARTAVTNAIAPVFSHLPALVRLNLSNTQVTNKFFDSNPFEECALLRHLNVECTRISSRAVALLAAVQLETLIVRRTWVQAEKVRFKLPGVKIICGHEQPRDIFPYGVSDDEILESLSSMKEYEQQRQQQQQQQQGNLGFHDDGAGDDEEGLNIHEGDEAPFGHVLGGN